MMNPLVSIMIPVFNGLPLIKASIESLLNQTYTNWECIIIDDGSNDGTSEYVDQLNDVRFKVFHQENKGRPIARQRALDNANGKYLGMLDAGDLYHPEKLQRQVQILEDRSDVVLVTSAMCSFGTMKDAIYIRGAEKTHDEVFHGTNHPTHAPSLMRMDIAKQCKYNPELLLGEDQDFLEKYLNKGDSFVRLADVFYYYSELDSVSKGKIRRNYYLYAVKYFREHKIKQSLIFSLKYLYAIVAFPFISIDTLLSKRGRKPSSEQFEQYQKFCKQLVLRAL